MMATAAPVKTRSPWRFAIPVVVFLLVLAGWGAAWVYIRGVVDANFDDWIAKEAAAGRIHECRERTYGGFPFHVELTCRRPVFRWDAPEGKITTRIERFTAVALIYRPEHVIVDLASPLSVDIPGTGAMELAFARGQASYSQDSGVFRRFSLTLDKPVFTRQGETVPDVAADAVEVHLRRAGGAASGRDFDVALDARLVATAGARPEGGANLTGQAVLRNWPDGPVEERGGLVAAWARGGGTLDLTQMRVARGAGLMTSTGTFGFTPQGRANGSFDAVVADVGALLAGVSIPGMGEPGALIGSALSFVGRPAEIEGRRGTRLTLRIDDGRVGLGAIPLFRLAPVF